MPTSPLPDELRDFLAKPNAGRERVDLRQDPRVSLTVMDTDSWYRHVSIIGRVAEMADDPDLSGIDRLSTHYLGNPYGQRDRPRGYRREREDDNSDDVQERIHRWIEANVR